MISQSGKNPGQITSVEIVKKGPSKRAETVRVGDTEISGSALRMGGWILSDALYPS